VIRFSPDLFRFDTSSTEELDGDSLEMLPLSPQIKKLETGKIIQVVKMWVEMQHVRTLPAPCVVSVEK